MGAPKLPHNEPTSFPCHCSYTLSLLGSGVFRVIMSNRSPPTAAAPDLCLVVLYCCNAETLANSDRTTSCLGGTSCRHVCKLTVNRSCELELLVRPFKHAQRDQVVGRALDKTILMQCVLLLIRAGLAYWLGYRFRVHIHGQPARACWNGPAYVIEHSIQHTISDLAAGCLVLLKKHHTQSGVRPFQVELKQGRTRA